MDFDWTEAQVAEYEHFRLGGKEKLGSRVSERTPGAPYNHTDWRACGELGLLGLCIPKEYGGRACSALMTARALEGFATGCPDVGLAFGAAIHLLACAVPILEFGQEALKKRVLPLLASGEWAGAHAVSEAEAGSDAFALTTTAERDGDSYVLNGEKSYVINGGLANLAVVYATTRPGHDAHGISVFAVERGTPGFIAGPPFGKIGLDSAQPCALRFQDCRIPAANLLGGENRGARIHERASLWQRACLFAIYLGAMDRQLEQVLRHAETRHQFGQSIGKFQAVAHRAADMKLRLEAARLLVYRACWRFDHGGVSEIDAAMAKLAVSEAAIQSGLDAIQLHGRIGVAREAAIERQLRDAIPATIFAGTSEMQREAIAHALGL